jgi:hypothetical protein
MVTKLDLRKDLKYLYSPSAKKPEVVEVPEFNFLMLNGMVAPGTPVAEASGFQEALQALYGISYTLKFAAKQDKDNPVDYPVMGLEGLWWIEEGLFDFAKKVPWHYTLLMLQPEFITPEQVEAARQKVIKKRGGSPELERVRFEPLHEGRALQIMHIGPFADEPRTLALMDAYAAEHGYQYRGKHHEIYLSDFRKADPEKLKTILRHPIED